MSGGEELAEEDALIDAAGSDDPESGPEEEAGPSKKRKRRSALACNFKNFHSDCVFSARAPRTDYPPSYVKNLEARVAELEASIMGYNPFDPLVNDHLGKPSGTDDPSFVVVNGSTSGTPRPSSADSSPERAQTERPADGHLDRPNASPSIPICPESSGRPDLISGARHAPARHPIITGPAELGRSPTPSLQRSPGGIQVVTSDGGRKGKVKDEIAAGVALLSLNSTAEAHYLGGSSGFSWAKVILGTLDQPPTERPPPTGERFLSQPILLAKTKIAAPDERPMFPTTEVTSALVDAFYLHVQAMYPFMDYVALRDWLARRGEIIPAADSPLASKDDRVAAFFIWLTFAVGSRLLQQSNLPGVSAPETYYIAALRHLDVITGLHNVENVQAFLLMAMYSFRCTQGPSAWHLIGISLRMCIDLGMHRRNPAKQRADPYREEIRRRVFWTTYGLDRMLSVSLGRPVGLDERDIDQPLPRNISADSIAVPLDDGGFKLNMDPGRFDYARDRETLTTMSSAIHVLKVRILESQIQRTIYRVDQPPRLLDSLRPEVDRTLDQLDEWVKASPVRPTGLPWARVPCCSPDWWLSKYEECRLLLLRPLTAGAKAGDVYLVKLAQSAANLCQLQLKLHRAPPIAHSLTSLHCIFLSGLTLLHAIQVDPTAISMGESSRAIRACSTTLFIYAQHFGAAEPFRDAFEDLATASVEGAHERQQAKNVAARREPCPVQAGNFQQEQWFGEMSAWMQNVDSQNNFVSLLATMGYAPPDQYVPVQTLPALTSRTDTGPIWGVDPSQGVNLDGSTPRLEQYAFLSDGTTATQSGGDWFQSDDETADWPADLQHGWPVPTRDDRPDVYGGFDG